MSPDFIRRLARMRRRRSRIARFIVMSCTACVLLGLFAIPLFLLDGLQPWNGLAPETWERLELLFGGSIRAAVCGVLVALPMGIATALFTAHFCAPALRAWIKPALELLEAMPTVVLGLMAAATVAPWLKQHVATLLAAIVIVPALLLAGGMAMGTRVRNERWLPLWLLPLVVALVAVVLAVAARHDSVEIGVLSPWNTLLVGLALGVATIPLVFSLSEDALSLVPREQTQAAFALGATRWQALTTVLLPAAGSGLLAAALLGLSRCLGETMIVLMASGNTPIGGFDLLAGLRSVSADLALRMPEAAPGNADYRGLLLATLLLLLLTLLLSALADLVRDRLRRRLHAYGQRA